MSTVHTADLGERERDELHAFLVAAFEGDFAGEDFEHALGGLHVVLREEVGWSRTRRSCSVSSCAVSFRSAPGTSRRWRCAKTGVGGGHGRAVLAEVERVIAAAYDLGALSTGLEGFYERSGWVRWLGPTYVLAPAGLTRTEEDDDGVLVLRTRTSPDLDLTGPLACDWRSGDVW